LIPYDSTFKDGFDHFARKAEEFLDFYRNTAGGKIYVEIQRRRISEILPLGRNADILDIGSGIGFITIPFAEEGHRVTLFDREPSMLAAADLFIKESGVEENCRTIEGEMENLDELEDSTFDAVLSFSTLEMSEHPSQAMREMVRVCKPGGKILIVTANYLSAMKDTLRRHDLEATQTLFETGIIEDRNHPKHYLRRAFRADVLWLLSESAGANVVYLKADRLLKELLGRDGIEKLAREWGIEECVKLEGALCDDPALIGAGRQYCVLAEKPHG